MAKISDNAVDAATALADQQLVALPTETVYGLGGLATSGPALDRIFQTKNRPADHPLIVHIDGVDSLDYWSSDAPVPAVKLALQFWPGPLTIVCPRSSRVLDAVTGGQPTVALRAPAHPLFQQVLRSLSEFGVASPGIAAPSANRFGSVSPTTASHVLAGLGEFLEPGDLILDGGPCTIGLESTIVICESAGVRVARSGAITAEQLAEVVDVLPALETEQVRVPGALAAHYSPAASVLLIDGDKDLSAIAGPLFDLDPSQIGIIGLESDLDTVGLGWIPLARPANPDEYAHELYAALRSADDLGLSHVVAVLPPPGGLADAIRDRLLRAARA